MKPTLRSLAILVAVLLCAGPAFTQSSRADAVAAQAIESKLTSTRFEMIDWAEKPLADCVREIAKKASINILIDNDVDKDEIDVTLDVRNVTAKNALNLTMRLARLKYEYADGVLWIVSKDSSTKSQVAVAIHDVRDITAQLRHFAGPTLELQGDSLNGPQFRYSTEEPLDSPDIDDLVDLIEQSVATDLWGTDGFSITGFNGQLVVSATPEVHAKVRNLLNQLR